MMIDLLPFGIFLFHTLTYRQTHSDVFVYRLIIMRKRNEYKYK
jgi:hypothetical protein